jgi:phage terminase large subunit
MTPELREAWREDPLKMQHALWPDVAFYDKQREIIYSVRDNIETIVPAGNQLGKDFVSGFIALWFFITHYQADKSRNWVRVITTSVKDDHLDVLWGEIARFVSGSCVPLSHKLGGPLVVTHHEIRHVNDMELSGGNAGSYLKGSVSAKGEGMQGHHAEHTLLIIDEASGVDDVVYNMGTTWAKRVLIIGNPHQCENFFKRGVKQGDLIA